MKQNTYSLNDLLKIEENLNLSIITLYKDCFQKVNHNRLSILEKYMTLIPQHYYKIFFLST